jgi:5'-methylthioadenosine phosphorylase
MEGPQFSSRAESLANRMLGHALIGMTQAVEAKLARELEMCYCNISLITDYDAGTAGAEPVTNDEVVRVFGQNNQKVKDLLFAMIPALPDERLCVCATALEGAVF